MLTIGSLCTGYGGLDMAVQSVVGGRLAWVSDILPASCTVLAAHHPDVPNLGDFTVTDWTTVERVDVFTAGYPCQPFSTAGKRKGTNDERHLWPYVRDAIRALRPRLVVLENVRGHLSLGFDAVLSDLAVLGMSARWGVVRASDAGAPHGRARLFIVAGDSVGHGHGLVLLPGGVGGVAPGAATEPRERQRSRGVTDPAGDLYAPDAEGGGRGTRPGRGAATTGHEVSRTGAGGGRDDAAGDARRFLDRDGVPAADTAGRRSGALGSDRASETGAAAGPRGDGERHVDWGKYEPAIRRWEHVLGRPAPAPAVPRATGRDRLSPAFVEWMMGLPAGHVTGHGLSHGAELTLLGNGVVPQQAALALRMLLPHALTPAA